MAFKRNDEAAVESVNMGAQTLNENAKLVGFISKAYEVESERTGSKALCFEFKSTRGHTIQQSVWYYSGNTGDDIKRGVATFSALLGLLGLDEAKTRPQTIALNTWNAEIAKFEDVDTKVNSYFQIIGKKIGCVFRMVSATARNPETGKYDLQRYDKNGNPVFNPELVMFYDPETECSYNELINELEPKEVDVVLDNLKYPSNHPLNPNAKPLQPVVKSNPAPTPAIDNFDDEIPF